MKGIAVVWMVALMGLMSCSKEDEQVQDYSEIDRQIIQEYLAENSITASETSSGLHYFIEDPGYGVRPTSNSYVTVKYRGYFTSGVIFDEAKEEVTFKLDGLIAGWREGIPLIKKGGIIHLYVPSHLAYGERGSGSVPPNTVLIFEIELVDVN